MQLDPYDDAAVLAQRLALPEARLIVLIGAEAWCEKCRALRPVFEAAAERARPHDVFVWLDLEDDAAFIGAYLPQDLPEVLIYEAGRLRHRHVIEPAAPALQAALDDSSATSSAGNDPGILRRLTASDWAI